jgi:hypothetical protein
LPDLEVAVQGEGVCQRAPGLVRPDMPAVDRDRSRAERSIVGDQEFPGVQDRAAAIGVRVVQGKFARAGFRQCARSRNRNAKLRVARLAHGQAVRAERERADTAQPNRVNGNAVRVQCSREADRAAGGQRVVDVERADRVNRRAPR